MSAGAAAREALERSEASPEAMQLASALDLPDALTWVLAGHDTAVAGYCKCGAPIDAAATLGIAEHQARLMLDMVRISRAVGPRKAAQRLAATVIDRTMKAAA